MYTYHITYRSKQVKPAAIVDTIVEAVVDILVPGRGAGESNWWEDIHAHNIEYALAMLQ